jgi:hypothetical protein
MSASMSETIATASYNVRRALNDDNPSRYSIDSTTLSYLIVTKAQELAAECGTAHTWVTTAFTLTVNSLTDYTLPTSVEYGTVELMRIPATGQTMQGVSMPVINAMREGLITGARGGGDPRYYCIYEDEPAAASVTAVKVRINTVPNVARDIDVYRSRIPSSTYTDATVLPFHELLCRAIERAVAMECLARMTVQQRAERMLGEDLPGVWGRDILEDIRREKYRQASMGTSQVLPGALSY